MYEILMNYVRNNKNAKLRFILKFFKIVIFHVKNIWSYCLTLEGGWPCPRQCTQCAHLLATLSGLRADLVAQTKAQRFLFTPNQTECGPSAASAVDSDFSAG